MLQSQLNTVGCRFLKATVDVRLLPDTVGYMTRVMQKAERLPSNSSVKKLLKAKQRAQPLPGTRSAFRESEKKYLSRNPPPDYGDVLDFLAPSLPPGTATYSLDQLHAGDDHGEETVSLSWTTNKVFTLDKHPGLFIIPGALSAAHQRRLIKRCMRDVTRRPNLNNLDTHYELPAEGLWYHFEGHLRNPVKFPDLKILTRANLACSGEKGKDKNRQVSRKLIENEPLNSAVPMEVLKSNKPPPLASDTVKPLPVSELLYKLRWTNLGLMYHWTSKSYDLNEVLEKGRETMIQVPQDLATLTTDILQAIPPALVPAEEDWTEFQVESGIVNFYQLKNTLMGHIDQSELVGDKPLVSLSFGHTAVFLIGGRTRDTAPTAIYLRSGDVLIMSGACRRVFHGVPRVVEGSLPDHLKHSSCWDAPDKSRASSEEQQDWDAFARYMSTTRININLRQVLPMSMLPGPGQAS